MLLLSMIWYLLSKCLSSPRSSSLRLGRSYIVRKVIFIYNMWIWFSPLTCSMISAPFFLSSVQQFQVVMSCQKWWLSFTTEQPDHLVWMTLEIGRKPFHMFLSMPNHNINFNSFYFVWVGAKPYSFGTSIIFDCRKKLKHCLSIYLTY